MNAIDQNNYIKMLQFGKTLSEDFLLKFDSMPKLRIGVLANFASQNFTHVLKASIFNSGFSSFIYEAEYDSADLEIYDDNSNLYQFKPDLVFLGTAVQQYRHRYFSCKTAEEKEQFSKHYLDNVLRLVDTLTSKGIRCIVSNLSLPSERMFGNFGLITQQSLYGSVLDFNNNLVIAAGAKNISILDIMYLSAQIGFSNFIDERLWVSAKYLTNNKFLPIVTKNLATQIAVLKGKVKKCIVLDLDNTLWGGIIGDDGINGIKLGHADAYSEAFQIFQSYILSLKLRGFILAVCSKNNYETAVSVFRNHPDMILKEDDIAVFIANWEDKASNIQTISKTLNIGLDSLIFIDDSPFERNLVKSLLPEVAVPEMPEDVTDYISVIEKSGILEASNFSKEDVHRNQMYREESLRSNELVHFTNIDEYLQSLQIQATCSSFMPEDMSRVTQLLQRSNQFNLRTQRYDEAGCTQFMIDPNTYFTLTIRIRDKFGDYGLISVLCGEIENNILKINELVMSCRVLKRGVEEFLMNKVINFCSSRKLSGIQGEYIESSKNAMVKDFYKTYGFSCIESYDGRHIWFLESKNFQIFKNFIKEV